MKRKLAIYAGLFIGEQQINMKHECMHSMFCRHILRVYIEYMTEYMSIAHAGLCMACAWANVWHMSEFVCIGINMFGNMFGNVWRMLAIGHTYYQITYAWVYMIYIWAYIYV